jgi:hypothetical protein
MASTIRGETRLFSEILELYREQVADETEGLNPKSQDRPSPNFLAGTDLGLGLLNELYYAFKKPNRTPGPVKIKNDETPREKSRRYPPRTAAQNEALVFFEKNGSGQIDSKKDLKKSFRRLAREFHPDAKATAGPIEKEQLSQLFRRLKVNYEVLFSYFDDFETHSSGV